MAEIVVEEVKEKADEFPAVISSILDRAAIELGRPFEEKPVHLRARDDAGNMLGGLTGTELQGWLYVRLLAVVPEARGKGVGGRLMQAVEDVARRKGLAGVYVDTFDFQAPEFYARIGYDEFGRLPDAGGQPARIFFAKAF